MKKKRKNPYLHVLIVADPSQKIRSYRINLPLLRLLLVSGVTLFLLVAAGLLYASQNSLRLYEALRERDKALAELKSAKEEQDKRLALLDQNAQAINEKLQGLTELEERVRRMLGLAPPKASRGGFSLKSEGQALSFDPDTSAQMIMAIEEKSKDLQQLLQEAAERLEYLARVPSMYPASGVLTSPFGLRRNPFGSGLEFHTGIDISVAVGTPVRASGRGTVSFTGWLGAYGKTVIVDHGYGLQSLYAHNSEILVQPGQKVERGEVLARSGNTGRSTGPHIHFEVRENGNPVDPLKYLGKEN